MLYKIFSADVCLHLVKH